MSETQNHILRFPEKEGAEQQEIIPQDIEISHITKELMEEMKRKLLQDGFDNIFEANSDGVLYTLRCASSSRTHLHLLPDSEKGQESNKMPHSPEIVEDTNI